MRRRHLRRIARCYPILAFLVTHDEVGPLLKAATRRWRPISHDEFIDRLQATNWWQQAKQREETGWADGRRR